MNVSIDVMIKEMVANEVALQLSLQRGQTGDTLQPLLTNATSDDSTNAVADAEAETTVDLEVQKKSEAAKKAAATRKANKEKKAKEAEEAKAQAEEAEPQAEEDTEEDFDLGTSEELEEDMTADELVSKIKAIMIKVSAPKGKLESSAVKKLAKSTLMEEFDYSKFGDVPAEERGVVLAKVSEALLSA